MSRNQTPLLAQAARGELIANGGRRYCRTCNCMKTAATFHKRGAMVRCDDCQRKAVAASAEAQRRARFPETTA